MIIQTTKYMPTFNSRDIVIFIILLKKNKIIGVIKQMTDS